MKIENIKLITYLYTKETNKVFRVERDFKNLNQLKQFIKDCGGIKSFKWDEEYSKGMYCITGEYKGEECYYEHKFGKYRWLDCNGYELR